MITQEQAKFLADIFNNKLLPVLEEESENFDKLYNSAKKVERIKKELETVSQKKSKTDCNDNVLAVHPENKQEQKLPIIWNTKKYVQNTTKALNIDTPGKVALCYIEEDQSQKNALDLTALTYYAFVEKEKIDLEALESLLERNSPTSNIYYPTSSPKAGKVALDSQNPHLNVAV